MVSVIIVHSEVNWKGRKYIEMQMRENIFDTFCTVFDGGIQVHLSLIFDIVLSL